MKKNITLAICATMLLASQLLAMSDADKKAAYDKIMSPSTSSTLKKTLINRFGGQASFDAYARSVAGTSTTPPPPAGGGAPTGGAPTGGPAAGGSAVADPVVTLIQDIGKLANEVKGKASGTVYETAVNAILK